MRWHANARLDPNELFMHHPVDSAYWKEVNRKWTNFIDEARNVCLELATDRFNPSENDNNS